MWNNGIDLIKKWDSWADWKQISAFAGQCSFQSHIANAFFHSNNIQFVDISDLDVVSLSRPYIYINRNNESDKDIVYKAFFCYH